MWGLADSRQKQHLQFSLAEHLVMSVLAVAAANLLARMVPARKALPKSLRPGFIGALTLAEPSREDRRHGRLQGYLTGLRDRDRVADESRALDSRIEYWAAYTGEDAEVYREMLRQGNAVHFVTDGNTCLHTIRPSEFV